MKGQLVTDSVNELIGKKLHYLVDYNSSEA